MRRFRDRHHIIPRARGGGSRNNIVVLPRSFHAALHTVFQDLKPEEYAAFLMEVLEPGKRWTSMKLHEARQRHKRYNR